MRYADEVNKAQGYFRDIADAKPDPDLLELAEALIERKSGHFDPNKFKDHYVDALHELIARKRKLKGGKIHAEEEDLPRRGSNVIDLMAALKRSIERPGEAKGGGTKKAAAKPAARKPAAKKAPAKAAPARKRA
jgi:DNA end-binding protein Ku